MRSKDLKRIKRKKQENPVVITSDFDESVLDNQISIEDVVAGVNYTKGVDEKVESIVPSEEHNKKYAQAKESVVQHKSSRRKMWSFIFLVVNIGIVVAIFLGMTEGGNMTSITDLKVNWWWLVATLAMIFVMLKLEQSKYKLLIKKSTKKKRPFLSYKVAIIGKYYDLITPLATGGQPFQVYYLTQRGVKASTAISIPIARYIFQQIIFAIFSTVLMIGSLTFLKADFVGGTGSTLVSAACWVGFILNMIAIGAIVLISTSKLGHKLVVGCLKLGHKMRIVKDYDKQYNKLIKTVEGYQRTMKFYAKSPKVMISMILLSVISLVIQYSIPFLVYCTFVGFELSVWLQTIVVALFVDLAASFIPLPGGSGVSELSFTAMFTALFGAETFWALLLWRLVTYYSQLLLGIGVTIYDYAIGNKKNERLMQKWKEDAERKRSKLFSDINNEDSTITTTNTDSIDTNTNSEEVLVNIEDNATAVESTTNEDVNSEEDK